MALHTGCKPRYACERSVISKTVTKGAFFSLGITFRNINNVRVGVYGMAEIYRLLFFGIEDYRKKDPADYKGGSQAADKIYQPAS